MCKGCLVAPAMRYGLCHSCRGMIAYNRPVARAAREAAREARAAQPPKPAPEPEPEPLRSEPVCGCGRDYLTLTVEEMSQPCPHPRTRR